MNACLLLSYLKLLYKLDTLEESNSVLRPQRHIWALGSIKHWIILSLETLAPLIPD